MQLPVIARGWRAGRIHDSRLRVRVGHADFTLETVGPGEEQAEYRTEVGHEPVRGTPRHQPVTEDIEGIE
jgi:hypothetical protein